MVFGTPWRAALLVLAAITTWRGGAARARGEADDRPSDSAAPRLVVVIVIDQLRADYLTRFAPLFGERGFRRLARDGADFTEAYFSYGCTGTAPGHATIATGALPSQHGIVGNEWYGPDGAKVYAVADERYPVIGPATDRAGRSPQQLIGSTLGDQLKLATNRRAKVWAVSLKDRAAILLGGKLADGAIWWDDGTGGFVSSSFYAPELPVWVAQMNAGKPADRFFHARWDRCLPDEAYERCCRADAASFERGQNAHLANTLPKVLGEQESTPSAAYYLALFASPFGNELVFELARAAIEAEHLGEDDVPDLLGVSLSSNDPVGHLFGPYSAEVLDMTVRTDRQLGEFLDWLDARIGLRRCLIALTADHGVGMESAYAEELRLGGGRVDTQRMTDDIEAVLVNEYGATKDGRHYVAGFKAPWVYLNESVLDDQNVEPVDAAVHAADVAAGRAGVAVAYALSELSGAASEADEPIAFYARRSAHPGRSGHVYVHPAPFWSLGPSCAEHTTAHSHDRHVPLILMGSEVLAGRQRRRADPCDIAVTLATLLEVECPTDACGRVLIEALRPCERPDH